MLKIQLKGYEKREHIRVYYVSFPSLFNHFNAFITVKPTNEIKTTPWNDEKNKNMRVYSIIFKDLLKSLP